MIVDELTSAIVHEGLLINVDGFRASKRMCNFYLINLLTITCNDEDYKVLNWLTDRKPN